MCTVYSYSDLFECDDSSFAKAILSWVPVAKVIKSSVFLEVECEKLILNVLNAFQIA